MKKRIFILFLSLISILSLASCSGNGDESGETTDIDDSSEVVLSEEAIGNKNAVLSDELLQFTVKIDNVVYKLPAMQSAFTTKGWNISEAGTTMINPSFTTSAILTNGKTTFDIQVINPTKENLSFEECPIGRLSYDFSGEAEILLADNFLLNEATKESIIEKYGDPESTEAHSDFSEIIYGSRKTSGNYASYLFRFDKSGKITYFSIVNHYMPD